MYFGKFFEPDNIRSLINSLIPDFTGNVDVSDNNMVPRTDR